MSIPLPIAYPQVFGNVQFFHVALSKVYLFSWKRPNNDHFDPQPFCYPKIPPRDLVATLQNYTWLVSPSKTVESMDNLKAQKMFS